MREGVWLYPELEDGEWGASVSLREPGQMLMQSAANCYLDPVGFIFIILQDILPLAPFCFCSNGLHVWLSFEVPQGFYVPGDALNQWVRASERHSSFVSSWIITPGTVASGLPLWDRAEITRWEFV